ncbi:MAG: hypothetical protein C4306_09590 [Thermoleophilia bacterium]
MTISFALAREARVAVEVRLEGTAVALLFVGVLGPGQQAFLWDGSVPTGRLGPGRYEVVVTATDTIASVSQSASLDVVFPP